MKAITATKMKNVINLRKTKANDCMYPHLKNINHGSCTASLYEKYIKWNYIFVMRYIMVGPILQAAGVRPTSKTLVVERQDNKRVVFFNITHTLTHLQTGTHTKRCYTSHQ